MANPTLTDLLTDLHGSLDRLADDLARDRPDLSAALRRKTALIPRPEDVAQPRRQSHTRRSALARVRPLLYHALDAGLVEPPQFDALMLLGTRAHRALNQPSAQSARRREVAP